MRYLLDTNIISNITKTTPSEPLLTWMADQKDDDLFIASLTVAEIRRGVLEKPSGKRRDKLEKWFWGRTVRRCFFRVGSYHFLTRKPD